MLRIYPLLASALLGFTFDASAATALSEREAAGKQIFLHGRSASGATVSARVGLASTPIPGSVVPCANCHGADGRGRAEGGVRPPDITWGRLTKPYGQRLANGREHPPYDEASFIRAVTQGMDAGENRLDTAMPRYTLSMRDQSDLAAYMQRLEDDRDPGLGADMLRIGTVLPTSGPLAELGGTVAAVLRGVIEVINADGGIHGRKIELLIADAGGDRQSGEAALRGMLDGDQVFALVSPMIPALAGDLSEMADAARVPIIGTLSQVSEGVEGARFLFDPLPGLREQLLALGEFAAGSLGLRDPAAAIVYPDDTRSRAMAQALAQRLAKRGWTHVTELAYPPASYDSAHTVSTLQEQGVQAVFFLGRDADFGAMTEAINGAMLSPYLFAAASQVGGAAIRAAPMLTERIFLAYPTLPQDWTPTGVAALNDVRKRGGLDGRHGAFQVAAYASAAVLAEGLKRAGRDASREGLVTALENLQGFQTGLTPTLEFGPGRRIGSPGAHIVTVDLQRRVFKPTGQYVRVDRPPKQGGLQ